MGRKTKWTKELRDELLTFFSDAERNGGKSVNETAELFAKRHKEFEPSQVKSAYYKFSNLEKKSQLHTNAWSEAENKELMDSIQNRTTTLTAAFDDFAKNHRRPIKNVSQHYYYLLRSQKNITPNTNTRTNTSSSMKNNSVSENSPKIIRVKRGYAEIDIDTLMNKIKNMPKDTLASISHLVETIDRHM